MASIKLKGDTSGELTIQAPAVAGTNTLDLPASSGTLLTTTGNGSQLTGLPNSYAGTKNRIINGNMRIDQRNAGASVTPANGGYTLDRWQTYINPLGKYTVQQDAGAVTPPVGFTNYLGATSTSSYSITSGDYFSITHNIEGYNIADLAWGTADAKTVTISFWVRSSLTGTFGGALRNSVANRSYPFSYTISVANTWEQKTITIPGDTTGTWVTDNGKGVALLFGLGVGSTRSGTAGSWAAANYISSTGATSVVGTSGATLYITGVQLEVGDTATDFENLQYGQQLAMCQRYFEIMGSSGSTSNGYAVCAVISSTLTRGNLWFKTEKRATPTITVAGTWYSLPQSITASASFFPSNTYNTGIGQTWSGLTVGQASYLYDGGSGTSRVLISAEL